MSKTSDNDRHRDVIAAMSEPAFYADGAERVEHRQTHISDVFLVGDRVYKVKKPVDTGFLDFTTLEKRKRFCFRELELNRRLSSGIYLNVERITRKNGRYGIGGDGEVVEYAVKMRRLDDHDSLQHMLLTDTVPSGFLADLADTLIDFYDQSASNREIRQGGDIELILANCLDNFKQMPAAARECVDRRKLDIIRVATEGFVKRHRELFEERIRRERICDCHGDLKTEHVYLSGGVQIIDCIEFNDQFRYQDAAADLAFLAMDMDFLEKPSSALKLLSRYVHTTGDRQLMLLIDFYKCYRAMVQVKVQGFKLADAADGRQEQYIDTIARYVDLAYRYAVKMVQPVLWVVCGLTASGKSTIAGRLSELFAVQWVRSDTIRKELFAGREDSGDDAFAAGMYSSAATSHVYARMLLAAQQELEAGRSVLIDATYRKTPDRKEVLRLAEENHVSVIFIECRCSEETVKERLKKREEEPGLSDARLKHWQDIKTTSNSYTDLPRQSHIILHTEETVEDCIEEVLSRMYELLAEQIRRQI